MKHLNPLHPGVRFRRAIFVVAAIGVLTLGSWSNRRLPLPMRTASASEGDGQAAPIYGATIPPGYRDWTLISIARVGTPLNDMRAKLGNDVAIKAYRAGTLPFPDGTIIARLAWNQIMSEANNQAISPAVEKQLGSAAAQKVLPDSFVAGAPTNVQFMVKDSKKYASTDGWGFAQFTDGKPDGEAVHSTCFSCHAPARDRDYVFTRYSR